MHDIRKPTHEERVLQRLGIPALDFLHEMDLQKIKRLNKPDSEFDPDQLRMGIEVEMEHTDDPELAKSIAKAHLLEIPDYYTRLERMKKSAAANESFGDSSWETAPVVSTMDPGYTPPEKMLVRVPYGGKKGVEYHKYRFIPNSKYIQMKKSAGTFAARHPAATIAGSALAGMGMAELIRAIAASRRERRAIRRRKSLDRILHPQSQEEAVSPGASKSSAGSGRSRGGAGVSPKLAAAGSGRSRGGAGVSPKLAAAGSGRSRGGAGVSPKLAAAGSGRSRGGAGVSPKLAAAGSRKSKSRDSVVKDAAKKVVSLQKAASKGSKIRTGKGVGGRRSDLVKPGKVTGGKRQGAKKLSAVNRGTKKKNVSEKPKGKMSAIRHFLWRIGSSIKHHFSKQAATKRLREKEKRYKQVVDITQKRADELKRIQAQADRIPDVDPTQLHRVDFDASGAGEKAGGEKKGGIHPALIVGGGLALGGAAYGASKYLGKRRRRKDDEDED